MVAIYSRYDNLTASLFSDPLNLGPNFSQSTLQGLAIFVLSLSSRISNV